jgi:hypothetical protein
VRLLRDADPPHQLHPDLLGTVAGPAAHPDRRQGDVLQRGQVREQVERLEDHPDLTAHSGDVANVIGELDAVHEDLATLVLLQAVDRPDEGRLAGPRGAEDDDHLAGPDGQVDPPQNVELAEPFVDVARNDDVGRLHVGRLLGRRGGRGSCLVAHSSTSLAHRDPTPSARSSR